MIPGLDSSLVAPSAAQARAAAAAGVPLWSGYLATRSGVGLLATWTQAAFDAARVAGCDPIGFCSGWDDPHRIAALADAWQVKPCLDVEARIRDDGPWVQAWLDASGAGLYGSARVHPGRRAAFHVVARYPGYDPGRTWPADLPRPAGPCGWQWWGTHTEFGASVDRGWYDDWFLAGAAPSFSSGQTGGSNVLIPSQHPTKAGRFDYFRVLGGKLGRAGSVAGGVGGAQNYAFTQGFVDYGPAEGQLLPEIAVTWTGDDRQVVTGTTVDGQGVSIVLREDGTVDQEWTGIGKVDVPTGLAAVVDVDAILAEGARRLSARPPTG